MTVSYTQTYSDNRNMLMHFQMQDQVLIDFKNTFDMNIYSFHNCSKEVVDYFNKINKLKNIKIILFEKHNNEYSNYTQSLNYIINYLKEIKCSSLFFIQDDGFSFSEEFDYENLHKIVKDKFISLSYDWNDFKEEGKDGLLMKTSKEFEENGYWSMNDSPYYTDFKFIDELYDEFYFRRSDVWSAELSLHNKFKNIDFNKYILEKSLFKNINIVGPTSKKDHNTCQRISGLPAKNFIKNKFEVEV